MGAGYDLRKGGAVSFAIATEDILNQQLSMFVLEPHRDLFYVLARLLAELGEGCLFARLEPCDNLRTIYTRA